MDWESWNGNFIIYYGQENITYHPEIEWQLMAKNVAQSPTFASYPIPDPDDFDNWQDWAFEVTTIINGPSY
jgi:hypothetical protein